MSDLEFEWDPKKEKANAKKHGVSFDDARTAFYDETAMVFHDPDHSNEEERFILLGMSVEQEFLWCATVYEMVIRSFALFPLAVLTSERRQTTGSIEHERALRFF